MLKILNKSIHDKNLNLQTIPYNGKFYLNHKYIFDHVKLLKYFAGLSVKSSSLNKVLHSDKVFSSYEVLVKFNHSACFLGYNPTFKEFSAILQIQISFSNTGDPEIFLWFSEKEVEEKITSHLTNPGFAAKKLKEFYENKSSKDIYEFILSRRDSIEDSKQILINELRKSTLKSPSLDKLNLKKIEFIKKSTKVETLYLAENNFTIEAKVYKSIDTLSNEHKPTILHIHGGGWVMGTPEEYDLISRYLAIKTKSTVVTIRYRLAPEHPFPAAFDDCFYAYLALRKVPEKNNYGINPNFILLAGDSIGGTFAASLVHRIHDENFQLPNGLILLSPATDMFLEKYKSYHTLSKNNPIFDPGLIGFLRGAYVPGDRWEDPYLSPIFGDLSYFPPCFMMIGEDDPLFDDNQFFVKKLKKQSNSPVDIYIGSNMPHHFHVFFAVTDAVDIVYDRMHQFICSIQQY